MRDRSFVDVSDHFRPGAGSLEQPHPGFRADAGADSRADPHAPSFRVRLTFGDGADVDVLAVVAHGRITIKDLHARPPLSRDDFAALVDWIERPLADDRRGEPPRPDERRRDGPATRHARPSWPRGGSGRRVVADAYRAAQEEGRDPVLAVMGATGRSRRKSLRLIAGARDAGYLSPRHNRRSR